MPCIIDSERENNAEAIHKDSSVNCNGAAKNTSPCEDDTAKSTNGTNDHTVDGVVAEKTNATEHEKTDVDGKDANDNENNEEKSDKTDETTKEKSTLNPEGDFLRLSIILRFCEDLCSSVLLNFQC